LPTDFHFPVNDNPILSPHEIQSKTT